MEPSTRRFRVADLEVSLRAPGVFDDLFRSYERCPSSTDPPDLVVELELEHGLRRPPARATPPGYDCDLDHTGALLLTRGDSCGRITIPEAPEEPTHAHFTIGQPLGAEAAVRVALSVTLPRHDGLILHASAVADGEIAHAFPGLSGAGKSTIADLLCSADPQRLKLSDELLAVRAVGASGRSWRAYVTPFHGHQGLPIGEVRDLATVFFISHGASHRRERLTPQAAVPHLLRHVLAYARSPRTASQVLACASRLSHSVPCFTLEFARDPSVARVLAVT
jgi:hypothetical protein